MNEHNCCGHVCCPHCHGERTKCVSITLLPNGTWRVANEDKPQPVTATHNTLRDATWDLCTRLLPDPYNERSK